MGPYYWFTHKLGCPTGSRNGSGSGRSRSPPAPACCSCCARSSAAARGVVVAALVYMLTPYPLAYTARISAILLPWAGLPWLIALAAREHRGAAVARPGDLRADRRSRSAARTRRRSMFAGIGPVLWIVFAVFVEREVSFRHALGVTATHRRARHRDVAVVDRGAVGPERLRASRCSTTPRRSRRSRPRRRRSRSCAGSGNWFFYGRDGLGRVDRAVACSTRQDVWLLVVSLVIPVLAFVAAVCVTVGGTAPTSSTLVLSARVIAVGPYPYGDPSYLGRAVQVLRRGLDGRARAAQHAASGPAGRARGRGPARERE